MTLGQFMLIPLHQALTVVGIFSHWIRFPGQIRCTEQIVAWPLVCPGPLEWCWCGPVFFLPPNQQGQQICVQNTVLIGGQPCFHFLLLDPATYEKLSAFPKASVLLVGGFNVAEISEAVSSQDFGGLCGQYLLMSDTEVQRHLEQGKIVGTGYPRSLPAFCRELSRGVTYLFSNQAQALAKILAQERLRLSLDPN